ncbi:TetR/AcrR family transcriptional regulator [Aestuariibacter sp. AA17]|uniref:TetR/AcrR family transcriptional regulator n=1 Tax=Fluctibacter corallii TaxID=2984329 RepID=A0ABT3A3Y7_9ALTE|nr:TetR/AcrR family transcriptional regulator [Aestuariibacter sp. AA17]MCV2883354.1 TetR/AcrR family transcriptional regulator [Aestuariibacter sp. AA17]
MIGQKTIIEPKQARSKRTQQKLLDALHSCLEEKFFENISIQEIAQRADVSVGSYYRRFRNKESLLPMLYDDFSNDLEAWIASLEVKHYGNLHDAIYSVNKEIWAFLDSKRSVLRTLHINARIYPDFVDNGRLQRRREEYERIAQVILRYRDEMTTTSAKSAVSMVIHTCVNGILDKVLYPDLTPAIASGHSIEEYVQTLSEMQYKYLT